MRFIVLPILSMLSLVRCATTVTHNGLTYDQHEGYDLLKEPKHGYARIDTEQKVCSGNNNVKAGYFVELRPPRQGEAASDYALYEAAEKIRVRLCSEAAMYCTTKLNNVCHPDDEKCSKERPLGNINTCRIRVPDILLKPHLHPIADGLWINCGSASGGNYSSAVGLISQTTGAWSKDRNKWQTHCQKYRSKDECELILNEFETWTYYIHPDANRWSVQTLNQTKTTIERDGNIIFGSSELDLTPSCHLLEKRH